MEAEKIWALEQTIALFERDVVAANNGDTGHGAGEANGGGDGSSDSSDSE